MKNLWFFWLFQLAAYDHWYGNQLKDVDIYVVFWKYVDLFSKANIFLYQVHDTDSIPLVKISFWK
jgi:hypothetical protein